MCAETCILISSHDRYASLAHFTQTQINKQWQDHPAVSFSGLSALNVSRLLELRRDPVDWIGVTLDAVHDLLSHGYHSVYLILDDHPPLGRCQQDLLNHVLPNILAERDATNISLFGSGQGRQAVGQITLDVCGGLEALPKSYLWKYSLHPGLWSLSKLQCLLDRLDADLTRLDARHPWSFERIGGGYRSMTDGEKVGSSYRIAAPFEVLWRKDKILSASYRSAGDLTRYTAGVVGGPNAWNRVSRRFDFAYHYFDGGYPIFWRGVMEKGRPNSEFKRFCKYFLKHNLMQTTLAALVPLDYGVPLKS